MIPTVRDIYDLIDRIAPFETAEEWDNVGLLAGRYDACAERAMCALELNTAVLREAIDRRAQLIITHHPILFSGRKNLREPGLSSGKYEHYPFCRWRICSFI